MYFPDVYDDYFFGSGFHGDAAGIGTVIVGIYLTMLAVGLAVGLVCYVVRSVSLYTLAKRRGLRWPGLAWVPVANAWTWGSVGDQYQYVKKGRVQSRRKVLLGLQIAIFVMAVILVLVFCYTIGVAVTADLYGYGMPEHYAMGLAVAILFFAPVLFVVTIVYAVFFYINLYQVYQSCNPDTATVFLVLSILFSVTLPFFLLADRNKDLGMPPRRPQPEVPNRLPPVPEQPESVTPPEAEDDTSELL